MLTFVKVKKKLHQIFITLYDTLQFDVTIFSEYYISRTTHISLFVKYLIKITSNIPANQQQIHARYSLKYTISNLYSMRVVDSASFSPPPNSYSDVNGSWSRLMANSWWTLIETAEASSNSEGTPGEFASCTCTTDPEGIQHRYRPCEPAIKIKSRLAPGDPE